MDKELLDALEDRWSFMADAIREMKADNAALTAKLAERDEEIARIQEEMGGLSGKIQALETERTQVGERVQALLKRFEEIDL